MSQAAQEMRQTWDESFEAQIASGAYNTSPVEAVVRTVAYYLRARFAAADLGALHFLDLGCGAGPNMLWLAEKGIKVSGIDISPNALALARETFARRQLGDRLGELYEGSVTELPFADESLDGAVEACVFQHLDRENRQRAFAEVSRVLKPGGVFVGYMLSNSHSIFLRQKDRQDPADPGTVTLSAEGSSKFHLGNIGLSHFFDRAEFAMLLPGWSTVDPCENGYDIPQEEAARRGYERYHQGMWTLYAVK
jgi:SAM-dependent methyltransferase